MNLIEWGLKSYLSTKFSLLMTFPVPMVEADLRIIQTE